MILEILRMTSGKNSHKRNKENSEDKFIINYGYIYKSHN